MVVEAQGGAERENRTDKDLHLLWQGIQDVQLQAPEVLQPGVLPEDEVGRVKESQVIYRLISTTKWFIIVLVICIDISHH